ncbi:hypothetical protein QJS10_CPB21g00820 [Acorus calamus]|uniref:Uncharacterized protein n=1 Tax=Acorus calamus TaxID=4465 RepID=A0AAV9C3B5_ACOCL|nr:hypothetical protein QJS10_CPB21g00820 [Acorus calamus]
MPIPTPPKTATRTNELMATPERFMRSKRSAASESSVVGVSETAEGGGGGGGGGRGRGGLKPRRLKPLLKDGSGDIRFNPR